MVPQLGAGHWLDLTAALAANQVLLTLLDYGPGLFELVDVDGNGGLCVRELQTAWDQLVRANCIIDNRFDAGLLPRQLSAIVGRGQPQALLATRPPIGPAWFRAMDGNRDGVLSAREFLGPNALFLRFDQDRNGLLDAAEGEDISTVQVARDAVPTTAP